MITGSVLAASEEFGISGVRCARPRSGFEPEAPRDGHVLVAVRRGAFVRRAEGREVLHDATRGYLAAPGVADQYAHPVRGGDVCVSIRLSDSLIAALAGGDPRLDIPDLPLDESGDRALRRLITAARLGDPAEQLVLTVAGLAARRAPQRVARGRPGTDAARGRLVRAAREILHAEPAAGLIELARRTGCSPHHLSRSFSQVTGSGVGRYRNRIRVAAAMERVEAGETDLAALACELGFADQAHLSRTVRALTGRPPSAWRRRPVKAD